MFKEFGFVIIVMLFIFLILQKTMEQKKKYIIYVFNISIVSCICINIIYNLKNIFPNYDYENVSIGDCKENLFSYKSDSQFQWQILFPMLQSREVKIYDKNGTYSKFMDMYSKQVETIELDEETKKKLESNYEWPLSEIELSMFLELDYVFPGYYFDYTKGFPKLYINYDDLDKSDNLIAYVDVEDNLYLMSDIYFENIR